MDVSTPRVGKWAPTPPSPAKSPRNEETPQQRAPILPADPIAEAKLWKSPVHKAHILTLIQIAQDVGADRAFLLSESGFQAGAIMAARHTNISLTNLAELEAAAEEVASETSIKASLSRVKVIEKKLRDFLERQRFLIPPPPLLEQTIDLLGACFEVTLITSDTLAGQFPVRLPSFFYESDPPFTSMISTVAKALESTAEELTNRTDVLERALIVRGQEMLPALDELVKAVDQLLSLGETLALDMPSNDDDATLRAALNAMRSISCHADAAREVSTENMRRAVRSLMGELINGAYIWLGDPNRSKAAWTGIEKNTRDKLKGMLEAAQGPPGHPK